jgi:endo-1,4-beta-xylanase
MIASLMAGVFSGVSAQTQGLHSLFVASGKLFFGTATDTNLFNDSAYQTIARNKNEFGLYVPENSQKWQPTEPKQEDFVFTNPDRVANQTKTNGQMFRCHTLTWHSQLPTFGKPPTSLTFQHLQSDQEPTVQNTTWTRDTLTLAIQTHITNVMTHFKGQCYSWDVVNEALNDNGTIRDDVFFQTLGTDYLPISFTAAAAADPAAKLYYNDFNLETLPAKTAGALKIVQLLQAANVRIDGVGFQAHLDVGKTPSMISLTATLNRFVALGLEVAFSELDIAHDKLPASASALQQQGTDYVSVVGACLAVQKCVGITVWEFTDKYSWIPSTFPGKGEACLFDANFTKKPAYTSVSNFLVEAAAVTGAAGGAGVVLASAPTVTPVADSSASASLALVSGGRRSVAGLGGVGSVLLALGWMMAMLMF